MTTITGLSVRDIRFPTSHFLDGSDAMNPDPDYSCAYVELTTDGALRGHGLSFTIGRGTEVVACAVEALRPLVVGLTLTDIATDMAGIWRRLTGDSQLRWLGPEKGVMHLATSAVVNAVWDLWAKAEAKPLWKLLADMTPEEVIRCVDFRYITDALTPDEALELLRAAAPGRPEREAHLLEHGYPAYTTSAGWLGYDDDKIRRLCREALALGFDHVKLKVGRDLEDDVRRLQVVREEIGPHKTLMVDANQVWNVDEAISWTRELTRFEPLWIEEPTSPDDVLGHAKIARAVAPIGVATGEHCHNRVMFKQLLQAGAITHCQIDACRLGGVNEVLAVLLMSTKFGVPVCPHAGGVGLCEMVQHLSMFDFIAVSGTMDGRLIEFVDHLHEHFEVPCVIERGRYQAPRRPGYSTEMKSTSLARFIFPEGAAWSAAQTAAVATAKS